MRKLWNVIKTVFFWLFRFLGAFLHALNPLSAYERQEDSQSSAYNRHNYAQPDDE